MRQPIKIGIVVGEASGDILGAALMVELRKIYPDAIFEGIGGPKMLEQGFTSFFPQDRLAVMGIIEPLKRIFELLGIRKYLREHFIQSPPAVFIGIDSPDFTIPLERSLKVHGIKTAHYVSPSVWAWRQGRVVKIAKSVDLMLTLLPFEAAFYKDHSVPVKFVGHHLADEMPLDVDTKGAREALGIPANATVVGLLPGSRASEIDKMGNLFVEVALSCLKERPDLIFYIPAANEDRFNQLKVVLAPYRDLPIKMVLGQSHTVMAASDVLLVASGTVTLEGMLLKKPMVVAYKMAALSFWLLSKLVKSKYISLPNLISGKELVPEILQNDATVERLTREVLRYFEHPKSTKELVQTFQGMHSALRQDASKTAAITIKDLIEKAI